MTHPLVELEVEGQRYRSFVSSKLTRSMDAFADRWEVAFAPRENQRSSERLVEVGNAVKLRMLGIDALEGYVDRDTIDADAKHVSRTASGRSRLGDLVDCSARLTGRSHQLRDISLVDLCRRLCEEYEVEVETVGLEDLEPLSTFTLKRKETIAEAIRRACRLRSVWTQDRGGVLELHRGRREHTRTVLEWGAGRILSMSRSRDWTQRFSHYRFRGQSAWRDVSSIRIAGGEEVEVRGREGYSRQVLRAQQVAQESRDFRMPRLRRLEVVAHGRRERDLGLRARMEQTQRAGRSESYDLEIAGWTTDEGALWRPGMIVQVRSDLHAVNAGLMVMGTVQAYGVQGQGGAQLRTLLRLSPPHAFGDEGTGEQVVLRPY